MRRIDKSITLLDKVSEWSIYILIFALPFSKSIVEITIVTALIGAVSKKILTKGDIFGIRRMENKLLYLFLFSSLLSIFNSHFISISIRAFFSKSLKFGLLFLVAGHIIDSREKLNKFLCVSLFSCAIILIDGFVQYFVTHVDLLHSYPSFKFVWANPSVLGAPTASFPFPNDFAAWMLIFIFPVGSYFIFGKPKLFKKFYFAIIFIALCYSLILTKVRGAWASFIGALGLLAILKPKTIGLVLLAVVLLFAALAYKDMLPYITALTSIQHRGEMWEVGWQIFKKHPIIGNGVNTFFNEFKAARTDADRNKRGSYAHNCYMQMACDAGIFGLLSFLAFVSVVLGKSFLSLKKMKDPFSYSLVLGLGLGIAAFLMHSAVDTNLYSLPLAALFWLSSGILLTMVRISESGT